MLDLSTPVWLLLGVSSFASVCVAALVWRRNDHVLFKVSVTVVSFIPVIGPIVGLWVTSFPDKLHPDLQAKYKNAVNVYSVPKEAIRRQVLGTGKDDGSNGPA